jgi:hypothetical protein
MREDWEDFAEQLSLHYMGWRALVDVVGADESVDEREQQEYVLDYVSAEVGDQEAVVHVAFEDGEPLVVENPTRLSLDETEEGADDVLEIESNTGTTRVRLRFPMQDEMIDQT